MRSASGGASHYQTTSHLLGRPTPCVVVTHEVSHAALAAHYAGYRDGCVVLVNEGRGQLTRSSLFRVDGDSLVWLEKDPLPWYSNGFGCSGLGYLFGLGEGPSVVGKIMALGAYGQPRAHLRELLAAVDPRISQDRARAIEVGRELAGRPEFTGGFDAMADVVATLQSMFTKSVYNLLARYVGVPAGADIALGGGCALNIVANAYLRERFGRDIAIPPACGDAGHLIGAGLYAYRFVLGEPVEPFSVYANGAAEAPAETVRVLTEAELARGGVVAMVDGPAELGPRALGNRSVLGDHTVPGRRKRMSEELKRREWFRPLGAVIRTDRLADLLPGQLPSPYMLFDYDVPAGRFDEARHIDGTSRLQTVTAAKHSRMDDLLGSSSG
jgi:carbamoyltransferase